MPRHIDKDPTEFFSVVGAPYVRENRSEPADRHTCSDPEPRRAAVAALWLAFYAAIVGVPLFASSGAAKLVEVAARW